MYFTFKLGKIIAGHITCQMILFSERLSQSLINIFILCYWECKLFPSICTESTSPSVDSYTSSNSRKSPPSLIRELSLESSRLQTGDASSYEGCVPGKQMMDAGPWVPVRPVPCAGPWGWALGFGLRSQCWLSAQCTVQRTCSECHSQQWPPGVPLIS